MPACRVPLVTGDIYRAGVVSSGACGCRVTNRYRLEGCGRRRFSVAGPFLWNKLPASVKSANSLGAFKSALKTHLFRDAFMALLY